VTEESAYERDMGSLRGLSAMEQDRLIAGHAPPADAQLDEVAAFMRALRAALPAQPDEHAEAGLVPRLAEVSAAASQADRDRVTAGVGLGTAHAGSRLGFVARVGIAVALLPALLASLAFAGVNLPDPAQNAFEAVGVDLPNQAAPSEKSAKDDDGDDGAATKQNSAQDGVSGGGNSSAAHQKALQKRQKARGKAIGHERGKAIGLNEATPPGHSGETGAPEHTNSGGSATNNAGGSAKSQSAPGRLDHSFPPSTRGKGHSK
jgi:hypothetical protein